MLLHINTIVSFNRIWWTGAAFHLPDSIFYSFIIKTSPIKQIQYLMCSPHTPIVLCKYLYTYIQPTCPFACISLDGTPGIFSSCTCPSHSCLHFCTCILHFLWCFVWRTLHNTAVTQVKENTQRSKGVKLKSNSNSNRFLNDTCYAAPQVSFSAWITVFLLFVLRIVSESYNLITW